MIRISKKKYAGFLIVALLWPFVLASTHWLNVHHNIQAAMIIGVPYTAVFLYMEYQAAKPLYSAKEKEEECKKVQK